MGRKLDLSGLTDVEAEHVMQVVQRDMQLRKAEETRLNEMKKALIEEGSRSVLLSQQHRFNERCCIRCCSPFTFLLNPRRSCLDCCYNICKNCCSYSKKDKGWLCGACQKSRLLKTQSLEWFYNNVRSRFKRFGSAKVLKNLYRRHAAEHGVLADLTEGSTYEESICNESSVYESDCTFYRQSEEHSMAETINVALRVAEEAIDEAIANAERQTDNQEKLNEAQYLRENRGELIEELATTIVHKIVRRKQDLTEIQAGGNVEQDCDEISPDQTPTVIDASLWRSHSAFCLVTDEKTGQLLNSGSKLSVSKMNTVEVKNSVPIQAMPSWRSVDRLDNSMLQSPDGNWIAYQSNLLSRPSLLTKRKSLVYSVLEQESGVISAYDEMGSETEPEANGVWGAALVELQRKMSATKLLTYPESYSRQSTLPLNAKGQYFTAQALNVDPENSSGQEGPFHDSQKSLLPFLKRKVPVEQRRASSARRPNVMDVNFNPGGAESSEDGLEDSRVKRSRRRRKSKKEEVEWRVHPGVPSPEPDSTAHLTDCLVKKRNAKQDSADTSDYTATPDILSSGTSTPDPFSPDSNALSSSSHGAHTGVASLDQELTSKLKELTSQVRQTRLSSTEDELDRLEFQMWNAEDETIATVTGEERILKNPVRSVETLKDDLTTRLIKLASQVSETQLSSTEDELDRFEDQTEEDDLNQPMRTEILGVDDRTDGDQVIKRANNPPNHMEKMRTEKRQKDTHETQNVKQKRKEAQNEIETVEAKKTEPRGASSCDLALGRFIGEDGQMELDRIIDTVVKTLGDMEEHIEAYTCEEEILDQKEYGHSVTELAIDNEEASEGCSGCVNSMEEKEMNDVSASGENVMKSRSGDSETIEQIRSSDESVQERGGNNQQDPDETSKDQNYPVHSTLCGQEYLSPDQIYKKYSAASLRSITTEVLRVLNATEDLIHGSVLDRERQETPREPLNISPTEARRLDEQLCRLEENVYVAAGAVYSLEAELGDLEECARSISGSSTERELTHLEEQLASASAQVQQSELQVSDISSRIAALKNAGLDVTPQIKFTKVKAPKSKTQTIDSSRKLRRRLPAPPKQGKT
ncbi:hypothetical protein DNTS_035480 [Danionella cerebrum]|uniref:RabBD domain-containing protein n=2 Tax=Danionella cerebrum TaxID=2873325 RepID=A0A553R659_9TELE|nr:hypothetical protein DNTS_035480 [Danionella translucida]